MAVPETLKTTCAPTSPALMRPLRTLAEVRAEMADSLECVEAGLLVDPETLRRWIEILDDELALRRAPDCGLPFDAPAEF